MIDFIAWRGERGARAWNSLNERLRIIARAHEPAKPAPKRAVMALGIASIAAVGGAAIVRVHETPGSAIAATETTEPVEQIIAIADPEVGLGGPLSVAPEPPSAEEFEIRPLPSPRFTPLELTAAPDLIEIPEYVAPVIRPPTLLERLSALNPLRDVSLRDDKSDDEEDS